MASTAVFPTLSSVGPFSLASSFPPIPSKLVSKIKSLQFVELKEPLTDNITALEQNSSVARPHDQLPKQREITSILTWVLAFSTYTAIIAEAYPAPTKELLAYTRLMVREASRGNSKCWLAYDRIFSQNTAANPSLSWANLDPSLHSSFCLGTELLPLVCSLCNELDHKALIVPCSSSQLHSRQHSRPLLPLPLRTFSPALQAALPGRNLLARRFTSHGTVVSACCLARVSSCTSVLHVNRTTWQRTVPSYRQTLCSSAQSAQNQQSHEAMVRVGVLLPLTELTGW